MNSTSVKSIQTKLLKKHEQISKLYNEIDILVDSLKGICDHTKTSTYSYTWSNGHGRHDYLKGTECDFCGWKDPDNKGIFSDPSTFRSQWDDD